MSLPVTITKVDMIYSFVNLLMLIMFLKFGKERRRIYAAKTKEHEGDIPALFKILMVSVVFQYIPLAFSVFFFQKYISVSNDELKIKILFFTVYALFPAYIEANRLIFSENRKYQRIISLIKAIFYLITVVVALLEIILGINDFFMAGAGLAISLAIMDGIEYFIDAVKE